MSLSQSALGYVLVGVFVVGRFLLRELRERRYDVGRIYLIPALLGIVALGLIVATITYEPASIGLLVASCTVAIVLGWGVGYGVARFTSVRVTHDPRLIYSRGSLATVAIWLLAFALRFAARFAVLAHGSESSTRTGLALNAALVLLLASALFFVRYRLVFMANRERALGIAAERPAI